MEINSNDLNLSNDKDLHFETNKNSVNCSWKKPVRQSQDLEIERTPQPIPKDKNFTFVQSEIDAEISKNILYSETGFQVSQFGGNNDDNQQLNLDSIIY